MQPQCQTKDFLLPILHGEKVADRRMRGSRSDGRRCGMRYHASLVLPLIRPSGTFSP